jgi:site-specific recombinase XerD
LGHKEITVTHLRKLMLDELQRRNYAQSTVRSYIYTVEDFAKFFHRVPDRLGPEHIREYQVHLFRDCKLSPGTIEGRTAALRFLFVKTLRRPYLPDHIPFPKRQRRMPTVLSQEEVARLIASARNLMHRTMLMMLYATGLRRAELCHLKVSGVDSERMVIVFAKARVAVIAMRRTKRSGGLDGEEWILGSVLQVSVGSGRYFRICEACGDRTGSIGRSRDRCRQTC